MLANVRGSCARKRDTDAYSTRVRLVPAAGAAAWSPTLVAPTQNTQHMHAHGRGNHSQSTCTESVQRGIRSADRKFAACISHQCTSVASIHARINMRASVWGLGSRHVYASRLIMNIHPRTSLCDGGSGFLCPVLACCRLGLRRPSIREPFELTAAFILWD